MKTVNKIICSVAAVIGLVTGGTAIYSDELIKPVGQVAIEGQSLGELRISPKALEITGNTEGCRLDPYNCPSGLVTNGIGNAHDVPPKPVSIEQVAKDWVKNLQEAERCVSKAESISGKAMSQGQFDAFVSFSFNTGCSRFMRNQNGTLTRIYSYAIAGDYHAACDELPRWVYGGGKKLPGLVNRRGLEHARCMEVG
ncbi:lysozyme [Vibrio aestuarianus]|uniref:lysozyme n=1 Tax=Vibrio aestuarianus TaxID=28171 RepID=UPI00237CCA36|nr:lysozyme [Vibrio aestuarianus]MDE1328500.1 lysozyme [Vibrio aestuarianus]